jgi:hypothetical protein
MSKITHASTLRARQIKHLLRLIAATSHHPERDAVILLLGHYCGPRIDKRVLRQAFVDVFF